MKKMLIATAATAALLSFAGTTQSADKKTLAFVVNGASDFWKAAEAGVRKAQGELPNYTLVFKYPEQSSAAIQTRMMDDLVAAGVDVQRDAAHGLQQIQAAAAGQHAGRRISPHPCRQVDDLAGF